jgi:hypothetical protein
MRARLFLRVLKHAREHKRREDNLYMARLCDVMVIAVNLDNHKPIKEQFLNSAFPRPKKVMALDDPNSAKILQAAFDSINHLVVQ